MNERTSVEFQPIPIVGRATLPDHPVEIRSPPGPSPQPAAAKRAPRANVHPIERAASVALGVALLALGRGRRSGARVGLSIASAPLLFRGLTGYCPVYAVAGVDTAPRPAPAPLPDAPLVTRSITIGRPRAEIARHLAAPDNLGTLVAHFAEVAVEPDGSARWTVRAPGGVELGWRTRLELAVDPDLLRWRIEGPVPGEVTVRLAAAPGARGTEVFLTVRVELPGGAPVRAAAERLELIPATLADGALRRLKSLLESSEVPTLEGNPSGRAEGER